MLELRVEERNHNDAFQETKAGWEDLKVVSIVTEREVVDNIKMPWFIGVENEGGKIKIIF